MPAYRFVRELARFPAIFQLQQQQQSPSAVALSARLATPAQRTAAVAEVLQVP